MKKNNRSKSWVIKVAAVIGFILFIYAAFLGFENDLARSTYTDIKHSRFPTIVCEKKMDGYKLTYKHPNGKEHVEYISKLGSRKVFKWLDKAGYKIPEKIGESCILSK